ncbi:hypothetical protein NLM33_05065 [Bradyrhizobium sp. CCGUVB1N3]|uniref:hypothetical protein n=1 Tax=Bradyrhizobium sp. CCGUVB1N3 TaxID=2949629 RepID=UPI0020B34A73|nr:hypothetical protein [Bradyrhizobium sp. CCGUVB1N3]MCP3469698.1 hypothetical protein [Bradyrhizobium sp. CCGUVB1N3]
MAKDSDPLAGVFETKESGGLLAGLLAEENEFDRRMMWRLGSWGAGAVGAVVIAVMASQAQLGWRRDQVAAADLTRQADRLQMLTRESQSEARRLASAIETLNTDRDRLYSRVTVLEQGLDSVTGTIAKQNAASSPTPAAKPQETAAAAAQPTPSPSPAAPNVAPVASTPAAGDKPRVDAAKEPARELNKEQSKEQSKDQFKEQIKQQAAPLPQTAAAASLVPQSSIPPAGLPTMPLVASKSLMAPPDPAAARLVQPETADKSEKADKADKTEKPEKAEQPKADAASPTEVATASPAAEPEAAESEQPAPAISVQQTRFAVDLGSANSIGGLRALWQGLIKSNPEIVNLRPIIMIKESKTGTGMQLRLGAGPLVNAAAAAKICAGLTENERACETTVFDGQRLSMRGQEAAPQQASPQAETPPTTAKPEKPQHRRSYSSKRTKREEPPPPPPAAAAPAPKQETTAASTISSFFSRNKN